MISDSHLKTRYTFSRVWEREQLALVRLVRKGTLRFILRGSDLKEDQPDHVELRKAVSIKKKKS